MSPPPRHGPRVRGGVASATINNVGPAGAKHMTGLRVTSEGVGRWAVPAVVFDPEQRTLRIEVKAIIGNSVPNSPSGQRKLKMWKRTVAAAAKAVRDGPLDPEWTYCVSAGFSFNPVEHGSRKLDVENFLKPTFDALAAGLFCSADQNTDEITHYNYDDSGFRYLFVHRLPDAPTVESEGVGIVVSIRTA